MNAEATASSGSPLWRLVVLAAAVASWLTVAASVAGCFGSTWWRFDLAAHFRMQWAIGLAIGAIVLLCSRRWLSGGVATAGLLLNVGLILAVVYPAPSVANGAAATPSLRFALANVLTSNRDHALLAAWVDEAKPAALFLQETNQRWLDAVAETLPGYRLIAAVPREDNFGIATFVSDEAPFELLGHQVIQFDGDLPAIEVVIRLSVRNGDGGPPTTRDVGVLSLHTLPPFRAKWSETRSAMLEQAATWVEQHRAAGREAVVIGDLNATPWSFAFRRLEAETGMLNSQRGHGIQPSWSAKRPWFMRIPIDHCLHSTGITTLQRELGPNIGSDHLPVFVELALLAPETGS